MLKRYSRPGLIFALAYLALFLLAEFITFFGLIFHTANSEMSGVLALLVTLPWSMLLARLLDAAGYVRWYGQFAGTPALYGFFASLVVLPGAMVNAAIAYYIGRAFGRSQA